MMLCGAYDNEKFKEQIRYIFVLFFSIYGIKWQVVSYGEFSSLRLRDGDVVISYGRKRPEGSFPYHIHIYSSYLFGPDYLKNSSMPQVPLKYFGNLPIIYRGEPSIGGHVRREGSVIETDIDMIAASFFMLVRYEEMLATERDQFGRFPATASVAYRERFLRRPVVNGYIDLLWDWISSLHIELVRRQLWQGSDFAACITHDVDRLRKYGLVPPLRKIADLTLKQRKPRQSLSLVMDYVKAKLKHDPFDQFDYLIDLAEKYGLKSSFYFLSGGDTDYDRRYTLRDVRITSLIEKIRKGGHEIGLHSSFDAYNNLHMLKRERDALAAALDGPVHGCRQHYLRWVTPGSWRAREKAGMKYDATLTFADRAGFRCGMCLPYKPFDAVENRALDIWEVPLTVMEDSFFNYQGLGPGEAKQSIFSLIEEVKKHKGLFMLLWHNASFDELQRPGSKYVYEAVLEYLRFQNVYNDTIAGIVNFWEDLIGRLNPTKITNG